MKKIAKITGIFLAVLMAISCLMIPAFAAGETSLTITSYGDFAVVTKCKTTATGVVDIPSEYNGVTVTHISNNAFSGCVKITEVNIPASIVDVGNNAFDGCDALKKVTFAGSSVTIDNATFNNCSSLESVILPSALKKIPERMFYGCRKLSSIEIPSTVTSIGKEAFGVCESLTKVDIPTSTTSIGKNAFIGCKSVASYNVASGNSAYKSIDGVLYGQYESKYSLIQYPNAKTNSTYSVASGTKTIADYAFGDNTYLTKITLPSGVEKLDNFAFYNCKKLAEIVIPSSVTFFGSQSFGRCTALKNITIPANVDTFESAFYMSGLESVVIANGVETIGTKAFENCTSLKSVTIPASVKTIGIGAFYGCTALENLSIPSTVTTLSRGAFQGCENITLLVDEGSAAHTYAVNNSINFKLNSDEVEKTVRSISVLSLPNKTSYNYKQNLDTTGLELIVNYTDGSSEKVTSGYKVSPTYFDRTGTHTINVTYGGCETSFTVSVSYSFIQWIIMILLLGFLWY